ncbi:MAG: hypothetical protein LUD02_01595 [Tannerellaceae bacterium]|nr:hypothetical protein [Tannerellaceae bacterium]MCD8262992.1 hypothetical protein [Tannerellaceae bacterium]
MEFTGEEFSCYYKNTSGFTFTPMLGKLLVEFNLTLVFPVFRIDETDYILATERDEWIVLEQDGETAIDLKQADY